MNPHSGCILLWILLMAELTDGGSVTWTKPTPLRTSSNPAEVLSPGTVVVSEGSSTTLNWKYSLTQGFSLAVLKFNDAGIVNINADGRPDRIYVGFEKRFSVESSNQTVSLHISPVTGADDKVNGQFVCEVIDSSADTWRRAIQVEVLDPAKTAEFQDEYMVPLNQSVTLNCSVEGNPPPTYTWTPCDLEQLCNKSTLDISSVCEDRRYTCEVTNRRGNAAKNTNLYIGGNVINITITLKSEPCKDGLSNKSSVEEALQKQLEDVFADKSGYEGGQTKEVKCGRKTITLELSFHSTTKEKDVIATLENAADRQGGQLGEFSVSDIKGKKCRGNQTNGLATPSPGRFSEERDWWKIVLIVLALGLVFGLVTGICCWKFAPWHTTKKVLPDVQSNGNQGMEMMP